MNSLRASAPQLAGLVPYDPKYLPAEVLISANENPRDVDAGLRELIAREVGKVAFNRYPDPLANELRDLIAAANGIAREQVLLGNGGDELLFDIALAWGGPGRAFLNMPPTFSVYAANARLTHTRVVDVPLREDFSVDEDAVLERVAQGDVEFVVVGSPNNPTGKFAPAGFIERLLSATDALVVADEAYCEFAGTNSVPLLADHENLLILRTFSKAYSLAGVRLGYVLGSARAITELVKVRQPYSVDAVSQAIGRVVFANREKFEPGIAEIVAERGRVERALGELPGIEVHPSDANWTFFRVLDAEGRPSSERAARLWQQLFDEGVLIRDFSASRGMEGSLRATVGTPGQNDRFLTIMRKWAD